MESIVKRYRDIFEQLRPTEEIPPDGLYAAAAVLTAAEVIADAIGKPTTLENTDYPFAVRTVDR